MEFKKCGGKHGCGEVKPVTEFYLKNGRPVSYCKDCDKKRAHKWDTSNRARRNEVNRASKTRQIERDGFRKKYPEDPIKVRNRSLDYMHRTGRRRPLEDCPECAPWLADKTEAILAEAFGAVERMPYGNRGYDFVCKQGYKIDAKAACIKDGRWCFYMRKNKIADYFICLGLTDRDPIEPCRVWIIPGDEVRDNMAISIRAKGSKWDKYEHPIDKVSVVCATKK
jgi:hypothetical protein